MRVMQHSIEIPAPVGAVFALCRDVKRWPAVFPPCKGARVVEESGGRQVIEISALAGGTINHWRSEREIDEAALTIAFRQVRPMPLLRRMEGTWRVFGVRAGSLLVLEHTYEALADVTGIREGVSTPEEAEELVARITDDNSTRELAAIRDVLAREARGGRPDDELSASFECEATIDAPAEAVYRALASVGDWPSFLPHCPSIEMHYDDGRDQELTMTVTVGERTERIRSVRHCDGAGSIRYFQPEPPPALQRHSGEWVLHPSGSSVRVVSRHEVVLSPEGAREAFGDLSARAALAKVESLVGANSKRTLAAVKAHVERPA